MRLLKSLTAVRLLVKSAGLLRDRRATVIIEMAACIPFFAVLGFGGLELANLALAHTHVSQLALNTADNASRMASGTSLTVPTVSEADIQEVFIGAEKQSGRLDFKRHGRIILSSLERNANGDQWLHWQRCFGDLSVASTFGAEGDGAVGKPVIAGMGPLGRQISAPPASAIMFVEIVYDYQPLVFGAWIGPQRIHMTAAFNIRENRNLTNGVSPSSGVATATCPTPA